MSRVLPWFIAGSAVAALGAYNYVLATVPPDNTPIVPSAGVEVAALGADEDFVVKPRAFSVTQTRQRPLFEPSRRAYVPPAPPPPPPAPKKNKPQMVAAPRPAAPPPDIRLYGVQVTPGGRKALVLGGNVAKPAWIGEGYDLNGWSVHAIGPTGLELRSGERSHVVKLHPDNGR